MHYLSLILAFNLFLNASCSKSSEAESEPVVTPVTPVVTAPLRTINVATAAELKTALTGARAGDEIVLKDGTYKGNFVIPTTANGTATNKILLRGSRNAILDADKITTGYVLHLQGDYWHIQGITLTNGLKGLMADGASYNLIDSIRVFNIGEEGIHLRKYSNHNTVRKALVTNVGLKTPDYGEGIYIGSAKSNWETYTDGNPDKCDSNIVEQCFIGPSITAECIDIKEGTTGGIIRNNTFDATGITGANSADSWMDVKGNYYLIEGNMGNNPAGSVLKDGYQVNVAYAGWGNYNEFKNNTCNVNAAGYGFLIRLTSSSGTAVGNKVYTSNVVNGAASGVSNIPLSSN